MEKAVLVPRSSGSTQSLKDLIYFTAKRKQHKSSFSVELSGSLGGKVQLGWGKRTQGCNVAFRLVWYKNPFQAAFSLVKRGRWVPLSWPHQVISWKRGFLGTAAGVLLHGAQDDLGVYPVSSAMCVHVYEIYLPG